MNAPDLTDPRPVDLLIRHAYLFTMDAERHVFPDGAIAVVGRRIIDVGEDAEVAARYHPARTIDAGRAPVHPGLIECHVHVSYQLIRGALPDSLVEADIFDAFLDTFFNGVTAEEEYLGSVLAALEMIRNGTTCFLEAGTAFEPSAVASAAELVGIRGVIGDPFIMEQPRGPSRLQASTLPTSGHVSGLITRAPRTLDDAIKALGKELKRNADPDALVTGHIALRGMGSASEELLVEAKRQADAAGVVVDMHHAYSVSGTAADVDYFGPDPLVYFAQVGILGRNVTLAHANYLSKADAEAVIETGASIAWAPAAAAMWGHDGSFRGRHAEMLRRGANIALGSDSSNWSNDFDLFKQANLAMLVARQAHLDRGYLVAEQGLEMATLHGARATGLEDRIGSIEVGKRADVVIHNLHRPELMPTTDMVRNLMYSSRSKSVHTVIVDGKVVLENGSFADIDEEQLLAKVDAASRAMLSRLDLAAEPNRISQ